MTDPEKISSDWVHIMVHSQTTYNLGGNGIRILIVRLTDNVLKVLMLVCSIGMLHIPTYH